MSKEILLPLVDGEVRYNLSCIPDKRDLCININKLLPFVGSAGSAKIKLINKLIHELYSIDIYEELNLSDEDFRRIQYEKSLTEDE